MSTVGLHAVAADSSKQTHIPRWLQDINLSQAGVTWHDLQRERRIEALMQLYIQEIDRDPEEAQRLRNELEAAMRNCRTEFLQAVNNAQQANQAFTSWRKQA